MIATIASLFIILPVLAQMFPWSPGHQLQIRYPGSDWITPGMELDIQATSKVPEISSSNLKCNKKYIAIFIDLDVVLPGTQTQSVILHWYQPSLSTNCTELNPPILAPVGEHEDIPHRTASYIAPRAPAHTHHRYVFLLFSQPPSYVLPECFTHVFPKTVEARAGFDIVLFIRAAGLDPPVAMNYFIGRHEPAKRETTTVFQSATTTSFRSVDCPISTTSFVAVNSHCHS